MNPNILGINWWFQLGVKMDMKRNKRFLVENLLFVRAEYVLFVSEKQGVGNGEGNFSHGRLKYISTSTIEQNAIY